MSLQHIADFLDALDQQEECIFAALKAQDDAISSYLDHPLYRKRKKEGFPTIRLGPEKKKNKAEAKLHTLFEQTHFTEEHVHSRCGKFRGELTRLYAKAMAATESVPSQLRDHWVATVKVLYGGQQKLLQNALEECRRSSRWPAGLNNVPDDDRKRQEGEHHCRTRDARAELVILHEKQNATLTGESPVKGKLRMTVEQANKKAMKLAHQMRAGFFALSKRQQARHIGCCWATWTKTPFYAKAQAKRPDSKRKKPSSPKTVSLTAERESVTGEGDRDEIANIVAERELQSLIADQETNYEPSPLEADTPGRPRKIHSRKRL